MRVAFFVNRFPMLSEQFILNQITGLIDRGLHLDIFATLPGNDPSLHTDVTEYRLLERTQYRHTGRGTRLDRARRGVDVLMKQARAHPLPLLRSLNVFAHGRKAASLDLLFASAALLGRPPYDVTHCHFGPAGLFAVRLRKSGVLSGKLVTTFYGSDVSEYPRQKGPAVYAPLVENGDLFISITDDMRVRLQRMGFPADRIAKVPLGVDLSVFTPRDRMLGAGETVRLLTIGRLVEKKGHATAIRAVADVASSHPNLHYRIIGDGPLRSELQNLIAVLGMQRQIELAGWKTQQEVRQRFDESHIFLLASETSKDGDEEGMPQVLKEAQAMALPVLSTRHSGIPELVIDGRTGFLVAERDVPAMAERLRFLIQHPEQWPLLGRAGRRHVEEIGDMEKANDRLVELYAGIHASRAA